MKSEETTRQRAIAAEVRTQVMALPRDDELNYLLDQLIAAASGEADAFQNILTKMRMYMSSYKGSNHNQERYKLAISRCEHLRPVREKSPLWPAVLA